MVEFVAQMGKESITFLTKYREMTDCEPSRMFDQLVTGKLWGDLMDSGVTSFDSDSDGSLVDVWVERVTFFLIQKLAWCGLISASQVLKNFLQQCLIYHRFS